MKYANDLDEDLKSLVINTVKAAGLENVVDVKPIRMISSSANIVEVVKGNALTELFAGEVIAVAIFEDAMNLMTDEGKVMMIENAIAQINYDIDKDKVNIVKPELNIPLGMYRKYGDEIVKTIEASIIAVDQVNEIEKQCKLAEKEAKKSNRKKA